MGNVIVGEQWIERYPWAYVDAAKAQVGLLLRGLREGALYPSATDTARLNAALDDLAIQTAQVRQHLAWLAARRDIPYSR